MLQDLKQFVDPYQFNAIEFRQELDKSVEFFL